MQTSTANRLTLATQTLSALYVAAGVCSLGYDWFRRSDVLEVSGLGRSVIFTLTSVAVLLSLLYVKARDALARPIVIPRRGSIEGIRGLRAHLYFMCLAGILAAVLGWFIVSALTPDGGTAPSARIADAKIVDDQTWGRGSCKRQLTVQGVQEKQRTYVGVCRFGGCISGFEDRKLEFDRIDLIIGENWAGRSVLKVAGRGP